MVKLPKSCLPWQNFACLGSHDKLKFWTLNNSTISCCFTYILLQGFTTGAVQLHLKSYTCDRTLTSRLEKKIHMTHFERKTFMHGHHSANTVSVALPDCKDQLIISVVEKYISLHHPQDVLDIVHLQKNQDWFHMNHFQMKLYLRFFLLPWYVLGGLVNMNTFLSIDHF